jgi:hypothetical protein
MAKKFENLTEKLSKKLKSERERKAFSICNEHIKVAMLCYFFNKSVLQ